MQDVSDQLTKIGIPLTNLTRSRFVIFSKPNCPYCEHAKQLIEFHGEEYSEYVLGADITKEQLLESFPTVKTVPVIIEIVGNATARFVGGFQQLQQLYGDDDGVRTNLY